MPSCFLEILRKQSTSSPLFQHSSWCLRQDTAGRLSLPESQGVPQVLQRNSAKLQGGREDQGPQFLKNTGRYFFEDRISPCNSSWTRTHCVDLWRAACLYLSDPSYLSPSNTGPAGNLKLSSENFYSSGLQCSATGNGTQEPFPILEAGRPQGWVQNTVSGSH